MGVVWGGPQRWAALTLAVVVATPMGAAWAATSPPPKPAKPVKSTAVTGTIWGDSAADAAALDLYGKNDAKKDAGSLATITGAIGARAVWQTKDAAGHAVTGRGVTVALVDSGVADVAGLNGAGKIVRGPDLSMEANSVEPLGPDTFGHGTHMAGIIAARDSVPVDPKTGAPKPVDGTSQLGVAPDAQLLALKLASTDGGTDISQVIAALDWVTQHRQDNGMNVRVVNLSFGTTALQPYQVDPLVAAAENAWHHGLVVVVSAGNEGADANGLTNPAIDPYVIAVGASDPLGKPGGWTAPVVADFSSRGTAARHADLLAPGRSIVSLRAPGSFVDVTHPEGRVAGDGAGRLFRGSGTSQAAAVVSGAAALLLQAYPQLTPDQVKAALVSTAGGFKTLDPLSTGAGQVNVSAADSAVRSALAARDKSTTLLAASQGFPVATGTGSLEAARGGSHLVDVDTGAVLSGEVDVQGMPWNGGAWAAGSASASNWVGGTWNGARWSGDGWSGARWSGARWSGARWSGARWSDVAWSGARWSGARWSDATWEGARWSGARWS
jgi:serine protease AprX